MKKTERKRDNVKVLLVDRYNIRERETETDKER